MDILYGINDVAVIVAAMVAIAVGSVWYSPLLFMRPWMQAVGLTEMQMQDAKPKMMQMFIISAFCNIIVLYVLAKFVTWSQRAGISALEMSLGVVVLLGAISLGAAVWEQKPIGYWIINIGYSAVVIIGGMFIIAYWPW